MRNSKICILSFLGAACAVQAAELPEQKSGLWETLTVQTGLPPITAKVCVDKGTQSWKGASEFQKSCTKLETHVAGSTVTRDAVCKLGTVTVTSHGVTTFQGNNTYRAEAHVHMDPAIVGTGDSTITVTAKWLGASCGAGMKPGYVMTSNGAIISSDGKVISGSLDTNAH